MPTGQKANKKQQACQQYREEIEEFYGISVQDEDKIRELYPQKFCSSSYKRIHNSRRKVKNFPKYYTVKSAVREVDKLWKHVKRAAGMEDCPVCKQLLQRGPKKKVQRARPKAVVSDQPEDASFAD